MAVDTSLRQSNHPVWENDFPLGGSKNRKRANMLSLLANGLVIAGACILIWALFPLRKLMDQLSPGRVLRKWYVLATLTLLFIVGYGSYAFAFWNRHTELAHLIVPGTSSSAPGLCD